MIPFLCLFHALFMLISFAGAGKEKPRPGVPSAGRFIPNVELG